MPVMHFFFFPFLLHRRFEDELHVNRLIFSFFGPRQRRKRRFSKRRPDTLLPFFFPFVSSVTPFVCPRHRSLIGPVFSLSSPFFFLIIFFPSSKRRGPPPFTCSALVNLFFFSRVTAPCFVWEATLRLLDGHFTISRN